MRREWWKFEVAADDGYLASPVDGLAPFQATEEEAQDALLAVAVALARSYSERFGYGATQGLGTLARIQVLGGPSSDRLLFSFVLTLRRLDPGENPGEKSGGFAVA
ncbi:hypothetical protein [Thermus sp.]|uniref:hypothetical protein n=1 Tax=Thermus sp. TaxID=275 RepID=UPI003D0F3297